MSNGARFDPRFDPAFQPGYEGPIVAPPPVENITVPQTVTAQSLGFDDPVETDEQQPDDAAPRRTNPFLIALAAVAVVLTAGGLVFVSQLRDLFVSTSGAADFDFVTMQAMMDIAPLIIVLGLATGVGLLFLLAVRWNRR